MKHVLVIRLSALGDVAIMVPMLKAYARANPDVRFTVAAPPLLEPLFEGMPNVAFLGVKKKQSAWNIYRQLKSTGADAVADLHQINRVGRALALLRIDALCHLHPLKVRRIRKGRLSRWLFLHHWLTQPRRPQWQRYADVFRRLGIPDTTFTPTSDLRPPTSPSASASPPSHSTRARYGLGRTPVYSPCNWHSMDDRCCSSAARKNPLNWKHWPHSTKTSPRWQASTRSGKSWK